jgi:hypothetical protein
MSGLDFGTIVCGGGPAGLGPLVAAAKRGHLTSVLNAGVLVVERDVRLGPGAIGRYGLRGNSFASAFLECLDTTVDEGLFDNVRTSQATEVLAKMGQEVPHLRLVADYLSAIGETIHSALEASPASGVAVRTSVRRVRLLVQGGVRVLLEPERAKPYEVTARRALLTLGGRPPKQMLDGELLPGLDLKAYAEKVVHSSTLLQGDTRLLGSTTKGRHPRVAVIGGSHSAWSVAWLLMQDPYESLRGGRPLIEILHRSPVRLFYMSVAEALADGYDLDPIADVCPLSGRVHRFSGLRGDARELAREVFGLIPGGQASRWVSCLSLRDAYAEAVVDILENADLIVSAIGYDAALPELQDVDGEPIMTRDGPVGLDVSRAGEIVDNKGASLPALTAYGLGAGLASSRMVGGEPSASTRADGVWLYQHDIGDLMLERIFLGEQGRLLNVG